MILDIVLIIGILFLGFLFYRQDKIIKTQIDYTEKIETNALETHKAISTALAKMKAAGIEVIKLPAPERAKLINAGRKYVKDWVNKANAAGLDGNSLLKQYRALLAKYGKQRDAKGYPWTR